MSNAYQGSVESITGEQVDLSSYEGQVCLVVNLASKWGLTGQYAGLRTLHEENKAQGFNVLGFPCNQFGAQEPGSNAEILEFAQSKYDVDFPMFAKVEVNGAGASELYQTLKQAQPGAEGKGDIGWNFTKFLVGRDGTPVARFEPQTTPEEIAAQLGEYLK